MNNQTPCRFQRFFYFVAGVVIASAGFWFAYKCLSPPSFFITMYGLAIMFSWYTTRPSALGFLPSPWPLGPVPRLAIQTFGLLVVAISYMNGRTLFCAYDCSPIVDVAWRMQCGQQPHLDFPCTLPPALYLLAQCCFATLETGWHSFVLAHAILAGIFYAWFADAFLFITKRAVESALLAFSLVMAGMCMHGFIYHTCLYTISYCGVVTSLLVLARSPASIRGRTGLFVFLMMLSWGKPLYVVTIPLLWIAAWCTIEYRLVNLVGIPSAAVVASLLALRGCGVRLSETISAYGSVSGRANPLGMLRQQWHGAPIEVSVLMLFGTIACVLCYMLWARSTDARSRGLALIAAGASVNAVYASAASAEAVLSYLVIAPVVIVLVDGFHVVTPDALTPGGHVIRRIAAILVVFSLSSSFVIGVTRTRLLGAIHFFEWDIERNSSYCDQGFFRGSIISRYQQHVDAVVRQLITQVGKDSKVFYATKLEYLYALTGIRSPVGLPLWWHPGTSYSIDDVDRITDVFF